jgi:6,7-dimethyl-8-ribityllumazine synthase
MSLPRPTAEPEYLRVAVVVSRFNEQLTTLLLKGALAQFEAHAPAGSTAEVYWVPGAFELPQTLQRLSTLRTSNATQPLYDGLLSLGCLIKGDTDHYEYIAAEATRGIGEVALHAPMPVCYGLLTCQTMAQAQHRARPTELNKGGEVMAALLEMIALRPNS